MPRKANQAGQACGENNLYRVVCALCPDAGGDGHGFVVFGVGAIRV